MSTEASLPAPPAPPRIRILEAAALPLVIAPLALLAPLEGELAMRAGDEPFRVRSGELLVLRDGAPLAIERARPGTRVALFETSPGWVAAFRTLHGGEPCATGALELVPAGAALARRAAQLLLAPRLEDGRGGAAVPAATAAALLEVAFQARGSLLDPRRARRRGDGRRESVVRAISEYDPEADGELSLRALAERLGVSERQTARILRAETGRSFRELKSTAQLERARKLLASSELPILEVALRAGWNSASQFHEAFRRAVGVTPARFRAAHRS